MLGTKALKHNTDCPWLLAKFLLTTTNLILLTGILDVSQTHIPSLLQNDAILMEKFQLENHSNNLYCTCHVCSFLAQTDEWRDTIKDRHAGTYRPDTDMFLWTRICNTSQYNISHSEWSGLAWGNKNTYPAWRQLSSQKLARTDV
jgi:hypothetical protein